MGSRRPRILLDEDVAAVVLALWTASYDIRWHLDRLEAIIVRAYLFFLQEFLVCTFHGQILLLRAYRCNHCERQRDSLHGLGIHLPIRGDMRALSLLGG